MGFESNKHKLTKSDDGTYTAYSVEFNEHYHSTKDGALNESLSKHVAPACKLKKDKKELHILDICFGLGFNTLATIYYYQKHSLDTKLFIYSPEFDKELISSLVDFSYPKEFEGFKKIINNISINNLHVDDSLHVEVFLGDAREYVKQFKNKFDIVYQDAFSPQTNPALWTKEYFCDIYNAMKKDGILTTYSTALKTRLALHVNDFFVYLNKGDGFRNATVASKQQIDIFEVVDMTHKIKCNPNVKPLSDIDFNNL